MKIIFNIRKLKYFIVCILFLHVIFIKCGVIIESENSIQPEITYSKLDFIIYDNIKLENFKKPIRVKENPATNEILILDKGRNCIFFFSQEGDYLRAVGKEGQGPGDLLFPEDMDIDLKGDIYVFEGGNKRISIFSAAGEFINSFNAHGTNRSYLTISNDGEILINDPESGYYITVYSRNGAKLRNIGEITQYNKNLMVNLVFSFGKPFKDNRNNYYIFIERMGIVKIYDEYSTLLKEVVLKGIEIMEKYRKANYVPPERQNTKGVLSYSFFHDILFRDNVFYITETNPSNPLITTIYILNNDLNVYDKINLPVNNKIFGNLNHISIELLSDSERFILLDPQNIQVLKYAKKK